MTEAKLQARIVRITIDQGEAGLFYATSPDIKGLLIAEKSIVDLEGAIPGAITDIYAACGEDVVVIPAVDERPGQATAMSWVKVPAEVAERALAAKAGRH